MLETRRIIPHTQLAVSPLCLGTANFIEEIGEDQGLAILDTFYEAGGNFINTAHEYMSEPLIAKWARSRGISRDKLVIVTKGGEDISVPGRDCHAMHFEELIQDCNESCERLKTDYVDIFELHIDDEEHVPVSEVMDALETIVRSGRARYVGVSNWRIHRIQEAREYCTAHAEKPFFVTNEIQWNLSHVNMENGATNCMWLDDPFQEYCRKTGLSVCAYSPQANGLFSKWKSRGDTWMADWQREQYDTAYNREMYRRILALSEKTGMSITEICISYIATQMHGFSSFPIIGADDPSQLVESIKSLDHPFDEEMLVALFGEGLPE